MTLELKDISLTVDGDTHIYPTDLALKEGGFNILLGTTLAGKTTLMRLMAGLERPSSGKIIFNGKDVTGMSVQKRDVAMVYQQFINYPNFTVYQNIASPMLIRGLSQQQIRESVEKVADLLQLTPMLQRLPNELSGGQQQRTALARALVKGSKLVLLDEPLANLDYKLREELREELPKLFRDTGATVVYATTEPGEALLLGGQCATMHEGSITQFGPTGDVYRAPSTEQTAKVFSDPPINLVKVTKKGKQVLLGGGFSWQAAAAFESLADGEYTAGIRPHHVTLNRNAPNSVPIVAEVQLTELTGSESTVHATVNGNNWISQSHGIHLLNPGDKVELFLNTDRCFFFNNSCQLVAM